MKKQQEDTKTMEGKRNLWKRYGCALGMVLLMVSGAEYAQEKEILFPEMAALAIGMWVVNKRVWRVKRFQLVALMTLGAVAGVGIVRYLPFPLVVNLAIAFAFAAGCLLIARSTLIPLISACMLPVLLGTESWVYPIAVGMLCSVLVGGQRFMEYWGWRQPVEYEPAERRWKKDIVRWGALGGSVFIVAGFAVWIACFYLILPPLVVTYVEFVNSKAGFRNRPVQVWTILVTASLLGTVFQILGHTYGHLPEWCIAGVVLLLLFTLFEWLGKCFAPAGALALVPMIVPQEGLIWLPIQVAAGAAIFITIALVFFQKCYRWQRAQLVYCLMPALFRKQLNRKAK